MVGVGFLRKKERILAVQCVQFGLMGTANLVLGAFSGFVSNMVGIGRNLAFSRWKANLPMKLIFIAVQTLLSVKGLAAGPIEWLPVLAAAIYTWCLDTKSEIRLKIVIITAQVMWLVYDLYYSNFVAALFDVLTIFSNAAGIFLVKKGK